MTKQEEILEHIAELLRSWCIEYEHDGHDDYLLYAASILEYLKSQGCVIKVDKRLPDNCIGYLEGEDGRILSVWSDEEKVSQAGFTAYEELF
jgi:hypothetical protein